MVSNLDQHIAISRIEVRSNVRDRVVEEEQIALAQSIRANGILVPLLGHREGDAVIVDDGHRRLDAATRAGLEVVPMILTERAPTASELLTLQLVANCQRSSLKTMERVRAIAKLMTESGWSASEVSLRLGGPSEATISKLLALLVLPREVQDLIDAARVPMSSAYAIATVESADEREQLVAGVLDGSLKRDGLVTRVKSLKRNHQQPRRAKRPARERFTIRVGPGRSLTVSGPNLTLTSLIEWLQALLKRIGTLEPQDMALADAAKALSADAPSKGVVS
ncbi:MAG TPA: ParB/RepB/Spo0J family partition protein [Phycisphaerae bacterium]|nr:ParB/RepB/Spo0J family partition protein [Phycisphaerae bacterium]